MPSLFARDFHVAVLASGSAGNCTYVGDGHAGVLVDCGISTRQVLARMEAVGLGGAPIDGVLVTHEHIDHCGAARVLSRRLARERGRPVPFFMTPGTLRALRPQTVPDEGVVPIRAGQPFRVRHLEIDPFVVPHDTDDPVAYRVGVGGTWVGVVTDLGRVTALVRRKVRSMSAAVLEFNHDVEMLLEGRYPWHLKQRIRSSHGHLSNDQAADLLADAAGGALRHVLLAHLSEENNHPDRARHRAEQALHAAGALHRVQVEVARQERAVVPVRLRADQW